MPKKVNVNIHIAADEKFARYQIYPTEELAKRIEKYRKSHPSRIPVSAAICALVHERLTQIEAHEKTKS